MSPHGDVDGDNADDECGPKPHLRIDLQRTNRPGLGQLLTLERPVAYDGRALFSGWPDR